MTYLCQLLEPDVASAYSPADYMHCFRYFVHFIFFLLAVKCQSHFIVLLHTDIILQQRLIETLKPCTCCAYKI